LRRTVFLLTVAQTVLDADLEGVRALPDAPAAELVDALAAQAAAVGDAGEEPVVGLGDVSLHQGALVVVPAGGGAHQPREAAAAQVLGGQAVATGELLPDELAGA